jgi:hypothetical protein
MTTPSQIENGSLESLVAQVVDEFMDRQRKGEQPEASEYAARYPQVADKLRGVLTALQVGGMGIVDEAEQISRDRCVAVVVRSIAATIPPHPDCDPIAALINASIDALFDEAFHHPVAKPQRLNLDFEANLVCDFGLAMHSDRLDSPRSMSPEQPLDRPFNEQTDVCSLDAADPDFVVTHDGAVLCKKEQDVA